MFNKISIIGCGLIGSSILRAVEEKKLANKISAYDKSLSVTNYLKKNILRTTFLRTSFFGRKNMLRTTILRTHFLRKNYFPDCWENEFILWE